MAALAATFEAGTSAGAISFWSKSPATVVKLHA
jgi:hypothetical protein